MVLAAAGAAVVGHWLEGAILLDRDVARFPRVGRQVESLHVPQVTAQGRGGFLRPGLERRHPGFGLLQ